MTTKKEQLLVERYPILGSGKRAKKGSGAYERAQEEIAQYKVGDLYQERYSTTSPPAFVHNTYWVTRKDSKGLWGAITGSDVREMTAAEV